MYDYHVVTEEKYGEEGPYLTFGLEVERDYQKIDYISDISRNRAKVEYLASRCNRGNLFPGHLRDLLEDEFVVEI